MKRLLHFSLIVLFLGLMSCEKEEQNLQNEFGNEVSNSIQNEEGLFNREIVVTDESGKNSALFKIYSDDENLLKEYLIVNKLTLKTNFDNIEILKTNDLNNQKQPNPNEENFDLDQKPKIIVELVTANLQNDVLSYSLEVISNQEGQTRDWIMGYPVSYTTKNDFIGSVHYGWGFKFIAKLAYKTKWYSKWKYLTVNGANAWWIVPQTWGSYYISLSTGNFYKRGIVIYPHRDQHQINYRIAYSHNDFRGHDCTIGTYTGNCYVGTPPVGTTAFIYANNFYYTPVNGNQCPRPGSWFDGANCFVMDIPNSCDPFIWSNKWYVKPDIIY